MGFPLPTIETWVLAKLKADSELDTLVDGRIYVTLAPQGTAMPYVVIGLNSNIDWQDLAYDNPSGRAVYLIKAVDSGDSKVGIGSCMTRVQAALQGISTTTPLRMHITRSGLIEYAQSVEGKRINHEGGLFRIDYS